MYKEIEKWVVRKIWFWEFVEDSNGCFKCKFCGHNFAMSATRIKAHLARYRGHDTEICKKVTMDVREEAHLAIEGVDNQVNT